MLINANTKIAKILKQNEAALDAIISITPKFEKLRNPLLRKLMAGRTSIAMASKISGCSVHDFFEKLKPLGFEVDTEVPIDETDVIPNLPPAFMNTLKPEDITELDVRPVIESGKDPLTPIMETVKTIQPGKAVKVINSFEPTPLIKVLKKKGFDSFIQTLEDGVVESFFYLPASQQEAQAADATEENSDDWDGMVSRFEGNMETVDVRELEMPQPMLTILATLEEMNDSKALYVYHKRIPVFLIPELKEKGYDLRIKTISDDQVHLLIFKN